MKTLVTASPTGGFDFHKEYHKNHNASQILCHLIHTGFGILGQENQDADGSADNRAGLDRKSEHYVQSRGGSAHVSNIKYQAAEGNQERDKITESRQNLVGNILAAHTGHTDNRPDV